jgi:hypothetical protein
MANLTYGTAEYYAELFGDILADVDAERPEYADAILNGFVQAVNDWLLYHDKQTKAYKVLRERVHQTLAV